MTTIRPMFLTCHTALHAGSSSGMGLVDLPKQFRGDSPTQMAADVCRQALQFQGIGAKTAAGYGFMGAEGQ